MNQALNIKNWSDKGNNYVLKGNNKNKWVGFQQTVLLELVEKFEDNFNIAIWVDEQNETDYYCIPYSALKHLFIEEHKTTGKYINRWTAIILNHRFLMHSNSQLSVDVSQYYAKKLLANPTIDLDADFLIENAKAEINIRIGQSKFRKGVLKNFNNKCALSGISELNLLRASHIIPWADRKECRADIANGICLYVEYDALFDEGFISFTNNLETIISPSYKSTSSHFIEKLNLIKGKFLQLPINKQININYLKYHREYILRK